MTLIPRCGKGWICYCHLQFQIDVSWEKKTPLREFYTTRVKISYQWGDYKSPVVLKWTFSVVFLPPLLWNEREGFEMWRRANERRCGRAVLAIGRQNERRDAVMRAGVTPAEVHANNATGPRQVTSNQTPVIVTRQTGNMHTNAVGPSVSISPDATNHTRCVFR